ncbi:MAG: hypothetical protein PHS45_04740 [Bacilli bacterium]|nr:hypothetical protein [Bacilli bacterium]
MVIVIEPEIILANLQAQDIYNRGIGSKEINDYCRAVREEFAIHEELKNESLYFCKNKDDILGAARIYSELFVLINDRVLRYRRANPSYFNARHSETISNILERVATRVMCPENNKEKGLYKR